MTSRLSPRLRVLQGERRGVIYHELWGTSWSVGAGALPILRMLAEGRTDEQILAAASGPGTAAFLRRLREAPFLFADPQAEARALEDRLALRASRAAAGKLITNLMLTVTRRCNLACEYCNVLHRTPDSPSTCQDMSFDLARQAMESYFQMVDPEHHAVQVIFFGGEPMLNWEVVQQSLEWLDSQDRGVPVNKSINTNGTLLAPDHVDFLFRHDCRVLLSLDGLREQNDRCRVYRSGRSSFARATRMLGHLAARPDRVSVISVISGQSAEELREFVDFLYAAGIRQVIFKPPILCDGAAGCGAAEEEEETEVLVEAMLYAHGKGMKTGYEDLIKPRLAFCQGIGSMLSVEPNGDVYPCPGGILTRLGTVWDLPAIVRTELYQRLALRIAGNIPSCKGCEVEGFCAGGCAGNAQQENGGEIYASASGMCGAMKSICRKLLVRQPPPGECAPGKQP